MRLLLLISIFILSLQAQDVLVINSNVNIQKYKQAQDGFSESFKKPFKILDISKMKNSEIKEYLYDEYPDIVYVIGAKAYQYANKYIPEKKIYFSSIMNWKRLFSDADQYGVSHELHYGMQFTLIKSIFNDIKTVGVIYSKYTEDMIDDITDNAEKLGIKIVLKKVRSSSIKNESFDDILEQTQAMLIIPDPVLLSDDEVVKNLFRLSKDYKKPVFAYHELFVEYGAALITSVDNPTIGRQIASMMTAGMKNEKIQQIQYPAGTKVLFNKKIVQELKMKFNENISSIVTEVIE